MSMEAAFQSYARAMKEVEDAQRKKEDIEVGGALKRESGDAKHEG